MYHHHLNVFTRPPKRRKRVKINSDAIEVCESTVLNFLKNVYVLAVFLGRKVAWVRGPARPAISAEKMFFFCNSASRNKHCNRTVEFDNNFVAAKVCGDFVSLTHGMLFLKIKAV
jgi:hypothetical protein